MKTIEEKAKEYGGSLTITRETQKTVTREDFEQAFLAGAQAVQEWIPCSQPPKDKKVVLLRLGGEMGEDQSWGIIPVTAYREKGNWFHALFGEEIEDWYVCEAWRPIEYK